MKNKDVDKVLKEWKKDNPEKFDAWMWFIKGVREHESYQNTQTGDYETAPMGKLVGEFNQEYEFWHREKYPHLYNQDMPENFHLADGKTIGGIIYTSDD